jgi:hypothetical protein
MVMISNTSDIRCTPEQAFDYLVDLRNELDWHPRVEAVDKVTDGPIAVGTTFREKWKGSPWIDVECVEYDRPRQWAYHNGGPIEVTYTARFEATPTGTRLYADFDATPHGWIRLLFPLFLRRLRTDERAAMDHIRTAVEAQVNG